MNFLELAKNRYTTKYYSTKRISDEDIAQPQRDFAPCPLVYQFTALAIRFYRRCRYQRSICQSLA